MQYIGIGLNFMVQCFPEHSFYKCFLSCLLKNALLYFCVNLQILLEKGERKEVRTVIVPFNPLTPELNPSAQRCVTRFLLGRSALKG
jgi:hypothetical protein